MTVDKWAKKIWDYLEKEHVLKLEEMFEYEKVLLLNDIQKIISSAQSDAIDTYEMEK